MKGNLTFNFLKLIEGGAFLLSDIVVVLTSPYGSSYGAMERRLENWQRSHKSFIEELQRHFENDRAFKNLLYRLKRDDLIEIQTNDGKKFLAITNKGRRQLIKLFKIFNNRLPDKKYQKVTDNELKILIFDIPEKERRKRDWLRVALSQSGFQMLQKSVWTGKVKLSNDFVNDMKELGLLSYIEIFAVTKSGSLKELKL